MHFSQKQRPRSGLKWKKSILTDIDTKSIDLFSAEIDKLYKLKRIDLRDAIVRKIQADCLHFVGMNMKGVAACCWGAYLEEALSWIGSLP